MRAFLKRGLRACLGRFGYEAMRRADLYDWQIAPRVGFDYNRSAQLPDGAREYLRRHNPKLQELQKRYADFDATVTTPLVWTDELIRDEDILYFRGDNAWVWQLRGKNNNVISYALAAYYIETIDELGLLDELAEDAYFGNYVFDINGRVVSRDLLDSILEIYFLDRHLGISKNEPNVLDIGAGYGRLAHRMTRGIGVKSYTCTDGVAISTFISDYYLGFRGAERARVVPLDEIEATLAEQDVDVAVNIHSFSECTAAAVDWWVSLLAARKVPHLMIVPNTLDHGGEQLLTNGRDDMLPILQDKGYRLIAKEPKYLDATVQQYALNPTYHYLFGLS